MEVRARNVSLQHWDKSAAELSPLEQLESNVSLHAVRELTDNVIYIGGTLNATEGLIYFRDLGKESVTGASAGSLPMLTFRENGRGITEKTWMERASRICRAADTCVDYTPDLAQTLSRLGVGINSALPPLAEDVYMAVCHGHGSARERFIVRMGKALNKALYDESKGKDDYTEQLGYALLSVPEGFVYDSKSRLSAFKQLETAIPEDDSGYNQKMTNIHEAKTLLLEASPFKSLEALLSLFDDLNGGTGVMYVRAERQCLRGDLVPHVVDGCKDIKDAETGKTLREYLGQTYLFHRAFRPLLKACVDEQRRQQQAVDPKRPPPVLLEPRIKLFVEGTEVKPEDHIFIRALKESKCINKEIDVKEVIDKDEQGCSIVLGWCTFAYQDGDFSKLEQLREEQRSGILEGYSCCLLSRESGFLDQTVKSAQSAFMHACKYWNRVTDPKHAFKHLQGMLKADPERSVEVPFSEAEARLWATYNVKPGSLTKRKGSNYKYCLGGAGVVGIFLLNEKYLPIKMAKDGPRAKSLLPYARALVFREMMLWVINGGPPGFLEERATVQREIANRQAEIRAEKAQAAAKKAAQPPKPNKAAASPPRQLPKRQSRDDANLKMTGKRKGAEQGPIELLPLPTAPARKKPNVAARMESLAFQADMVDYGTKGYHSPSKLMRIAQKAWSLAKKQDQHKAASLPPGHSEKIGRLLQELEDELNAARLLISQ